MDITTSMNENFCRIEIKDNGIGIPQEKASYLFEPFRRLHSEQAYPGIGLGLSIVKRVVELMNGVMGVDSRKEQGSNFWIELPLARSH